MKEDLYNFRDFVEFDDHALVSYVQDKATGMEGFIAVHRMNKKVPSFGATRMWIYDSHKDALCDALRLAKLMSYKAALAGIPAGGAKAVLIGNKKDKTAQLRSYAKSLRFLDTTFITGTDVGLDQSDLKILRKETKNIIGFNGNSTDCTTLGIYFGIEACLEAAYGTPSLKDRTFAIQGLGKVGAGLLKLIYASAKTIYVAEVNKTLLAAVVKKYPKVVVVKPSDIHKQQVDVFSPSALSHSITQASIKELKCRIIAGGANNQLATDEMGDQLHKRGILYAPDYVINAGGLIAVYDEYEFPKYSHERVSKKIRHIKKTLGKIIKESQSSGIATNRVANMMAEKIFNAYAA